MAKVVMVYFLPEDGMWGQLVHNHISYDLIREAAECNYTDIKDFFRHLERNCIEELSDLDNDYAKEWIEKFLCGKYNFVGKTSKTMRELIKTARNAQA